MKDPWLKFYPGDYLRDPAVRSVCLAARGLWTDMLCLMHGSEHPCYLAHQGGQPINNVQLARMVGGDFSEVEVEREVWPRSGHGGSSDHLRAEQRGQPVPG